MNQEKLHYDLAIAYAKIRFRYDLDHDLIKYSKTAPEEADEVSHFQKLFAFAYDDLCNTPMEFLSQD